MRTVSRRVWPTLALLALAGCKSDPPSNREGDAAAAASPAAEIDLFTPYLEIGERLAADRQDNVGPLAQAIDGAASTMQGEPGVAAIRAAAASLPADDLEATRATYRDLSHALLDYLDAHPDQRAELHLAYCPMAFANQGAYWLAAKPEIRNPYEGSRMLECGALLGWDEAVEHRKRWAAK